MWDSSLDEAWRRPTRLLQFRALKHVHYRSSWLHQVDRHTPYDTAKRTQPNTLKEHSVCTLSKMILILTAPLLHRERDREREERERERRPALLSCRSLTSSQLHSYTHLHREREIARERDRERREREREASFAQLQVSHISQLTFRHIFITFHSAVFT